MTTGSGSTGVPHVRAKLDVKLGDFSLKTSVPVPQGKTTVRYMLPLFRGIADAVVKAASEKSAGAGKPVSCRKGCSACCYQLVPVTEAEAYSIAALVESMPEERRKRVLFRFADTKGKLKDAALWDAISSIRTAGPEHFNLAMAYLRARVACPFLEEDACSIHADRPISCREYMVSSDPKWCWHSETGRVVPVEGVASVGDAVAATGTLPGEHPRRISLPLILEYVAGHAEPAGEKTGPVVLQEVLSRLAGVIREINQEAAAPRNELTI